MPELTERELLTEQLSPDIGESDLKNIWTSVDQILGTYDSQDPKCTLALGYVQSGKTTSIAALMAAAVDTGFDIVIGFLGSTLLLRDQNTDRLEAMLGMREARYRWVVLRDIKGKSSTEEVNDQLRKSRKIFLPVLKHAGQIRKLAQALSGVASSHRVLIIDDEADQASLNTRPEEDSPSSTYSAIASLRNECPDHLYVQYTATPFAPLLLPPHDPLMPTHVEFLQPGTGYTGGREFLITRAHEVVRAIPNTDETTKTQIDRLPQSLITAFAAFTAGAAVLLAKEGRQTAPISMLVHPTHRNDAQRKYEFLLRRFIARVRESDDLRHGEFGQLLSGEYERLIGNGVGALPSDEFWDKVRFVLSELTLWLVNSTSDVTKVHWNQSPCHILIGGNKLDRGFTVEGLTVTYLNRKASEQVDTLEQRARAFGYRSEYLPFCQLFASHRTLRILRGVVHTEDDLRSNLRDHLDAGGSVESWAEGVGFDLPAGTRPSRKNVLPALKNFNSDGPWHSLRRPMMDSLSWSANRDIIAGLGLLEAERRRFGRLSHPFLSIPLDRVVAEVIAPWSLDDTSPSWRQDEIVDYLVRHPRPSDEIPVILMARNEDGELVPRERSWESDIGFINLFQGRDPERSTSPRYEGDRTVGPDLISSDGVALQVHFVRRKGMSEEGLFTLAIYLGDRQTTTRESSG